MRLLELRPHGMRLLPKWARFSGPPKPDGVPRRTWEVLFRPRTGTTTRLTAALAVIQLLTTDDGDGCKQSVYDSGCPGPAERKE